MAYIFGMNGIPVFEMLFILMILMLAGLVFVLLEIKKLVKLVAKEKMDINRFEADLAQFEGKKTSPGLVNYVRNAQDQGLKRNQIQNSMSSAGWQDKHITNVFNKINKSF